MIIFSLSSILSTSQVYPECGQQLSISHLKLVLFIKSPSSRYLIITYTINLTFPNFPFNKYLNGLPYFFKIQLNDIQLFLMTLQLYSNNSKSLTLSFIFNLILKLIL